MIYKRQLDHKLITYMRLSNCVFALSRTALLLSRYYILVGFFTLANLPERTCHWVHQYRLHYRLRHLFRCWARYDSLQLLNIFDCCIYESGQQSVCDEPRMPAKYPLRSIYRPLNHPTECAHNQFKITRFESDSLAQSRKNSPKYCIGYTCNFGCRQVTFDELK